MTLLALDRVTVRRGSCPVVDAASLCLAPGDFVALIGPNGAGKTTLMRAAVGLVPATGTVALEGVPLGRLSARERALRAAYLPQEREIAWPLAVEALVALGRTPHRRLGAPLGAADRAAIERALAEADALALRDRPATELSGGERARVLIARALAQEAPLLLADEPTAGLDPAHAIALMTTLARRAAAGGGVLVSMHDLGLAARFCPRLVLMDRGRVAADGPAEAVLTPETLARSYGITARIAREDGALVVLPTGLATRP